MGEVSLASTITPIEIYDFHFYWIFSRAILTYLTAAYSKDDTLYPRDIRMRALVDQRLQFDLGTLSARLSNVIVSINFLFYQTFLQVKLHFFPGIFSSQYCSMAVHSMNKRRKN